MKKLVSVKRINNLIFKSFIALFMVLCTSALQAQNPTDFSGTWTQDNAKSDDFYKDFNVKFIITQTPQAITIKQTFFDKSGKEMATRNSSFNLDGKEVSKEENGGVNKELASWSQDKKILTTKSTRTVGTDLYGSSTTYSLSDNGLVLTVQTTDVNPFGPSVKQILNKNQ